MNTDTVMLAKPKTTRNATTNISTSVRCFS